MPDIVLKNILGQDVTYTGIDTVKLKNTAGDDETFSHGVAVENVPIELDLVNGETQTIYAPVGTLVKSAVVSITGGGGGDAVEMEETELPFVEGSGAYQAMLPITRLFYNATYTVMWNGTEHTCTCKAMEFADSLILTVGNAAFVGGEDTGELFLIAQLPDMVGCITTEANATNTVGLTLNFEAGGGGGGVKVAFGTVNGAGSNASGTVINHNLGVTPDIIYAFTTTRPTNTNTNYYSYSSCLGLSKPLGELLKSSSFQYINLFRKSSSNYEVYNTARANNIENTTSDNYTICKANETSVQIGGFYYFFENGVSVTWIAIGGLT